jgi:hypothetical protein
MKLLMIPRGGELVKYLYSLSSETRGELIIFNANWPGRPYERAVETRSKYTTTDDQATYLMSKAFHLAEYLRMGLAAISD